MKCYAMTYRVTETLQNGSERTKRVTVYAPHEHDGHPLIDIGRYEKAESLLASRHYYNISCESERETELLMVE